jgi:hypothetical protein
VHCMLLIIRIQKIGHKKRVTSSLLKLTNITLDNIIIYFFFGGRHSGSSVAGSASHR